MKQLSYILGLCLFVLNCTEEVKNGASLGVPEIEPPVTRSMPSGLGGSTSLAFSGNANDCTLFYTGECARDDMVAILNERIFSGREGCLDSSPSDVVGRVRCYLDVADSRMASLEARSQDVARLCVKKPVESFDLTMPVKGAVTQRYNCQEPMTDEATGTTSLYVAFGVENENFYMREVYTRGRMTMATANSSTEEVDVWTVDTRTVDSSASSDSSETVPGTAANNGKKAVSVTQIIAKPNSNVFEIATATNHRMGNGVGCGVQIRANANYIYGVGIWGEPTEELGYQTDCEASETSATRYMEVCLNAATLDETDLSNCSDINTFTVSRLRPSTIPEDLYTRMIDTSFTSLTQFNEEDPDAIEEKSGM